MKRRLLAEKLVSAQNGKAINRLLTLNRNSADERLAAALKDICYAAWTNEPTKAQSAALALEELAKINPLKEIKAFSHWICGIARITEGRLDSAVENLDQSAALFRQLKREHESAQTQVAKLYPLAVLGRFQEAMKTGNQALKIFDKYGDELAAGKVEMNLGNILSRHELHRQAKNSYASAHRRFLALGETGWLTMCENGLAITYAALNDFRRAERFYEQALMRAQTAKMPVTEAEIEASIGNLALFRGQLDRALRFLELSRRRYETLEMPHQTAIAELEIADIYLELNLTDEAFAIYERVAASLQTLKMQGEEARARANFGRAAVLRSENDLAREELKKSARLYVLENNKVGAAAVKLSEATLELNSGNYRKTLKLAREAERFLEKSENTRYRLTARWIEAEARRKLGESVKAGELLARIYTDSTKMEQPETARLAQISLGKIALEANDFPQAEKHFKQAVKLIERLRAPLAAEEFRMAFLANKLAPYENLAKIYLAKDKLKQAFAMVERARARVLAEGLGSAIDNEQNNFSPKLAKKLEDLREELNWFYSRINRADDSEIENLQAEAKNRENQIADLMRQVESTRTNGNAANAANVEKSTTGAAKFASLQNEIGGERALIEFVNFGGEIAAFVVTDKKISFVKNLARESEIISFLESLRFQFDALRYGAKNLDAHLAELKKRADFYLHKLYERLIEPLEKFIGKRNLIVVPVNALYYIPFHALYDGAKYLIETRETVYAPSATVWRFLASKPVQKLKTALLFGFADERIPYVNQEIENLRGIFPQTKSFTGKQASFATFIENAPNFDVLHFACHGNFRPENPLFSSLHLADGWITVRDICAQNLKAEIVTLSACETGLNRIFAGDEILGLARGFLAAGASSLILSLWTVNDRAATDLMKIFYAELRTGKTAAEALKIAQNDFIKCGYHPYFWSPFALIGR